MGGPGRNHLRGLCLTIFVSQECSSPIKFLCLSVVRCIFLITLRTHTETSRAPLFGGCQVNFNLINLVSELLCCHHSLWGQIGQAWSSNLVFQCIRHSLVSSFYCMAHYSICQEKKFSKSRLSDGWKTLLWSLILQIQYSIREPFY